MSHWLILCRCFLLVLAVVTLQWNSVAQSAAYDASIVISSNGKPMLHITNHHKYAMTAFAVTVDITAGTGSAEYRRYYDAHVDPSQDHSVAPEQSTTIPVGSVVGSDTSKLIPRIRAVTFSDGTTVGEPIWIAAIRERRQRSYAMARKINDLLEARFGMDAQVVGLLADLTSLRANVDAMPLDEFRIVEDVQLHSALTTVDLARKHGTKTDNIITSYARTLRWRRAKLEEQGSLLDKSGAYRLGNTPVPPLPWEDTSAGNARTAALVATVPRTYLKSTLLRLDNSRGFSLGIPRLRLATVWNCYVDGYADSLVLTGGCNVNGTNANQRYDLRAVIGSYDPLSGTRVFYQYDNGEATAYGTCWSGYTDCAGNGHGAGLNVGQISQHFIADDGVNYRFTWIMDSWNSPVTSSCSCNDPNPYGIIFTAPQNSPYAVGMLYLKKEQSNSCLVNYSP